MMIEESAAASGEARFQTLADLFSQLDVFSSPAELHGLLCAKLACNANFSEAEWRRVAAVFLERDDPSPADADVLLMAELALTREQLSSAEFGLELVLPADDEAVALRVEEIGRWCVGFTAGMDRKKIGRLSTEAKESLDDLNEIANIEIPEDSRDGDERDLIEIAEYVRLAATMIFLELNPQGPSDEESQTIH